MCQNLFFCFLQFPKPDWSEYKYQFILIKPTFLRINSQMFVILHNFLFCINFNCWGIRYLSPVANTFFHWIIYVAWQIPIRWLFIYN